MNFVFRETAQTDIETLFEIRASTRENPMSREDLAAMGITPASIIAALRSGALKSWVCLDGESIVGFCSAAHGGEVTVLAVLPAYEGKGVGSSLLAHAVEWLRSRSNGRVWLAASSDPTCRAHGFYRSQGWEATGTRQSNGDEILVYSPRGPFAPQVIGFYLWRGLTIVAADERFRGLRMLRMRVHWTRSQLNFGVRQQYDAV